MSRPARGSAAGAFPGQAGRSAWHSTAAVHARNDRIFERHRKASLGNGNFNVRRNLNVARRAKMVAAAALGAGPDSAGYAVHGVGASCAFLVGTDLAHSIHHLRAWHPQINHTSTAM